MGSSALSSGRMNEGDGSRKVRPRTHLLDGQGTHDYQLMTDKI